MHRRPWPGKLLDQLERHEEARAWFHDMLLAFVQAFEQIAPAVSEPDPDRA